MISSPRPDARPRRSDVSCPTSKVSASTACPPEERLVLAEARFDSVAQEEASLSEAQRAELERRLAKSIANPSVGTPWEVAEARALERIAKR